MNRNIEETLTIPTKAALTTEKSVSCSVKRRDKNCQREAEAAKWRKDNTKGGSIVIFLTPAKDGVSKGVTVILFLSVLLH